MLRLTGSGGVRPALDAVEARREHARQRQVRVRGRIGRAQLDPGRAAALGGDADRGRAVAGRPGDVDGRLVAGQEPLVGVDGRVGDRGDRRDVLEDAGDVGAALRRELESSPSSRNAFSSPAGERLVDVHARAVLAVDRLGHERRVHPVTGGDRLDHQPERDQVVGGRERVGVAEVDLVLADRDLVVGGLELEAHLLERDLDVAPAVLAAVDRRDVEVRRGVVRVDGRVAVGDRA